MLGLERQLRGGRLGFVLTPADSARLDRVNKLLIYQVQVNW